MAYVARGDLDKAAFLSPRPPAVIPRSGSCLPKSSCAPKVAEGRAAIVQALARSGPDAGRGRPGRRLRETNPEAGYQPIDAVADAALAERLRRGGGRAARIHDARAFAPRRPMRLVEICVDGGLEATMYEAQARWRMRISTGPRDGSADHQRRPGRARAVEPRQHRSLPSRAGDARRARSRRDHFGSSERRKPVPGHREDGSERGGQFRHGCPPAEAGRRGRTKKPARRNRSRSISTAMRTIRGRAAARRRAAAIARSGVPRDARRVAPAVRGGSRRGAVSPGPHVSRDGHA